ncbi:Coq4 family protein [Cylindrospermum sp. FACHB-282]|uniref:Coq4 family protein n=1 Tax=Cylindrospermum sp. FACHB-282 TaxID=2692794 RepID=UPI00168940C2|nr:Coq4 family protein [Cylindrospermum sp. FACHB-282]MBD2385493.1 hypothetical protein [Cylindrospermum sp. FACHB-282]
METQNAVVGVQTNQNILLNDPNFVQSLLGIATNPEDLSWYFKLEEAMKQLETVEVSEYIEQLRLTPEADKLIEERYVGPQYKLEDLNRNCAPGTLGYVYYHHMTGNGIPAYDYGAYESPDDATYIKLRKMQTHDIWHVITGYKTDVLGELALQGFCHGQGPTVYQTLIMIGMTLHFATAKNQILNKALDGLFEGWQRGRDAKPLWSVRWEEMWDRPLEDLQRELNVLPGRVLLAD